MNKSEEISGYVYLLETSEGYTKVGYTHQNVYRRFYQNQFQYLDYNFVGVYCYFSTKTPKFYEGKVHGLLSKYRIGVTEIFKIGPSEVEEIIKQKCKKLYNGLNDYESMSLDEDKYMRQEKKYDEELYELEEKIKKVKKYIVNYDEYKKSIDDENTLIEEKNYSIQENITQLKFGYYICLLVALINFIIQSAWSLAFIAVAIILFLYTKNMEYKKIKTKKNCIPKEAYEAHMKSLIRQKNNLISKRYPNPAMRI